MKWLADENFRNAVVRGLLRRSSGFDIVRAQDIGQVSGEDDLVMFDWATREGRVVLTHDLSTMIPAMNRQTRNASRCAPIVLVPDSLPIASVIEEILLLDECSIDSDWAAGVIYLRLVGCSGAASFRSSCVSFLVPLTKKFASPFCAPTKYAHGRSDPRAETASIQPRTGAKSQGQIRMR